MKLKLMLISLIILLTGVYMDAANLKKGDWIERQGSESKLWYQGEVLSVEGKKVTIGLWGWMDSEPEVIEDMSILRKKGPDTEVVIRKNGSIWAKVEKNGDIRINGSIVGSISSDDGTIRKSGSIVGEIYFHGAIRKSGSEVGSIQTSGELYQNGQIIGDIDNQDGTIRLSGSICGNIENFAHTYREMRMTAAVLAFFASEFGY